MKRGTRVLALALMLAALSAAGCASDPSQGYSSLGTYPGHIRTVAVPIPENDTYVRDVEFELADALVKEIEAHTPYKVTSRNRADSVLTAQVRQVELRQLSKSRVTGLSEEVVMTVTIDFAWRDLIAETTLVERRSFTGQGLFVPSAPSSERIEIGRFAAVQQLARDVVAELRSAW
jgi:hypothetical protein